MGERVRVRDWADLIDEADGYRVDRIKPCERCSGNVKRRAALDDAHGEGYQCEDCGQAYLAVDAI